jgi:hypothetical protein
MAAAAMEFDQRDLLARSRSGLTATKGTPIRCAKYASDTAVDPTTPRPPSCVDDQAVAQAVEKERAR